MRAWWVQEMLATPSPLTERMTLFWHNHFVSSQQKVRFARLMYAQNATLRANALGSFATLLHAASKDPAMLIYLDIAQSRKGQPNENFAREVMELFTLGEGQYTEQDIKEARARLHRLEPRSRHGHVTCSGRAIHDYGVKTVLGRRGRFDGDAVLDIILARPQTSRVHHGQAVARIRVARSRSARGQAHRADLPRPQDYDVKAALRALLLSDAFWAPDNRGTLVKSPVELVVGHAAPARDRAGLRDAVRRRRRQAWDRTCSRRPNVKGWPGGETWINSNTLLARKQFLDRLARMDERALPMAMMAIADAQGARIAGEPMAGERRVPKAALAPQGAQDDDKARAQRFAQRWTAACATCRSTRRAGSRASPAQRPRRKMQSAQALLLPLAPVIADPPRGGRRRAGVRARHAARSRLPAQVAHPRRTTAWIAARFCIPRPRSGRRACAGPLAVFGAAEVAVAAAPAARTTASCSCWSS